MRFDEAYYQWAVAWAETEWMEDFPHLGNISNPLAQNYVCFIRSLSLHEQRDAIRAILRRFHPVALKSEPLTELETTYVTRFRDQNVRPLQPGIDYEDLNQKRVESALKAKFHRAVFESQDGNIQMTIRGAKWDVQTTIDITRSPGRVVYHHDLCRGNHVFLAQWISILGWMGIAGQSEWRDIVDVDSVLQTLVRSISVFVSSPLMTFLGTDC